MNKKIIDILIKHNTISSKDIDIYEYGLFVLWFNFIIIFSFLLQGIITSHFVFTILFLIFYLPLRIYLGGYHCKTPKRCFILSNIFYFTILILYKYFSKLYIFALFTIIIVYFIHHKYNNHNYILLIIIIIEIMLSTISTLRIYIITSFLSNILLYMIYILQRTIINHKKIFMK